MKTKKNKERAASSGDPKNPAKGKKEGSQEKWALENMHTLRHAEEIWQTGVRRK